VFLEYLLVFRRQVATAGVGETAAWLACFLHGDARGAVGAVGARASVFSHAKTSEEASTDPSLALSLLSLPLLYLSLLLLLLYLSLLLLLLPRRATAACCHSLWCVECVVCCVECVECVECVLLSVLCCVECVVLCRVVLSVLS